MVGVVNSKEERVESLRRKLWTRYHEGSRSMYWSTQQEEVAVVRLGKREREETKNNSERRGVEEERLRESNHL